MLRRLDGSSKKRYTTHNITRDILLTYIWISYSKRSITIDITDLVRVILFLNTRNYLICNGYIVFLKETYGS
jgi:hypothetical protein